ncbi:MAG: hypothetical protein Q7J35_06985 [Candidatus Methanoperedens sp.]|nr:hypothetical protein [Candidatus Methanoperedens sp.]
MTKYIVKPTAKSANSSIVKRSIELAFGLKSEKYILYAWILLLLISILLAFILQNWVVDIQPARVQADVGISVTRLDMERLEVMIISLEKDADFEYLTYNTSNGSGYINRSIDPFSPVRDTGDNGIIPVPGYNEHVEIFANLRDARIRIFSQIV